MAHLPDSITIGGISIPVTLRPVTTKGREMTRETTTIYPNQPDPTFPEFRSVHDALTIALLEADPLNQEGAPTRSRELSLAITNIEQAMHWLEHAPVKRDQEEKQDGDNVGYTVDDAQVAYPLPPADTYAVTASEGVAGHEREVKSKVEDLMATVAKADRKIDELTSGVAERDLVIKRLREELAVVQRERDALRETVEAGEESLTRWIRSHNQLRVERNCLEDALQGFVNALNELDIRLEYV